MKAQPSAGISGKSINRRILDLAIPNIISNLSVPLLSSVDTALMGHLDSDSYLAAIALGSTVFNVIYWGFGFLRMGTTGMTAHALGAGDTTEVARILGRGLLVALAGSLLLIVLQWPIAEFGFMLMDGSAPVKGLAREYFFIRIYAAPATIALYAFHGWFLGMQNARYPLILTIVVNLLNLGFNLLFLKVFDMKSDGIALGTVCAQYCGLLLAVGLYAHKYSAFAKQWTLRSLLDAAGLAHFFKVNSDILIRTLCLIFTFSFVIAVSGQFGDTAIAVNSILLLMLSIMAYGVDGFAFAAESLVGLYKGARDGVRLKLVIKWIFVWGMGGAAMFSLAYFFFDDWIYSLLTDRPRIIAEIEPYRVWAVMLPVLSAAAFLWDGIYLGATVSRPLRDTMIFAAFGIFLPVYFLSVGSMGNHGIWLAMSLFMVARSVSLSLLAKKKLFFSG